MTTRSTTRRRINPNRPDEIRAARMERPQKHRVSEEAQALRKKFEEKARPSDESHLVASMVANRLGLQSKRLTKGVSGCYLVDFCLESPKGLSGAILIYRAGIPTKARSLKGLLGSFGDRTIEEIFDKKRRGAKHPRRILEDELREAKEIAGSWVSPERTRDVAVVFRASCGTLMVYSGEISGKLRGVSKPSGSPVISLWAESDNVLVPRRLSTLDAFLSNT